MSTGSIAHRSAKYYQSTMKLIILLSNLLLVTNVSAMGSQKSKNNLSHYETDLIHEAINSVVSKEKYNIRPEKLNFTITSIQDPKYFFHSNFKLTSLLTFRKKYCIRVNPQVFAYSISQDALIGVISHELIHTEDYDTHGILNTGIKYFQNRVKYERTTDIKAVFKGFGEELIEYKTFQQQVLTPEVLKEKRKYYLTIEEVDFLIDKIQKKKNLDQFYKALIKKTPRNLEQMIELWNKLK